MHGSHGPQLDPELRKGIQAISATEFNVGRLQTINGLEVASPEKALEAYGTSSTTSARVLT